MKYLVSISYDGSKYYGFERQPKLKTVQGEIERVLKKISKEDITIKGAGRTDRGVHAIDQKAHFELSNNIPCDGLRDAMNSLLDDYIYINYVKEANDEFHARFDCKSKTYEYYLNVGEYNPIKNDYISISPQQVQKIYDSAPRMMKIPKSYGIYYQKCF